ncbi:MAG: HAMP domain-containing sensor histidine kinase [Nostoc sp. ChiSLP02]|nr:HAMP domain-containing sensor histidine kinase [Nostoc sp. DedSLP05]MDZ8098961.1 HAMP domain-containing sensor histidine kinase [Nostoc sp. DedSLP01]MDZ8185863.1 HAMP domain-containing sensor histidine kinase [Nostoc sp. ChiSLP02]
MNITNQQQQATPIKEEDCYQAIMPLDGEQQNLPQQLQILQRLIQLSNQGIMPLNNLLEQIAQELYDAIESADFCFLLLYNFQTKQLELSAKAGINVDKFYFTVINTNTKFLIKNCQQKITHFPLEENNYLSLLYQVFGTGISQLFQKIQENIENITENFIVPSCMPLCTSCFTPSSIYAIPIELKPAERLGVLVIGNWENPDVFNIVVQNLLNTVGELIAIAINNARTAALLAEHEQHIARQNEIILQQNRELEKIQHEIQLKNLQLSEVEELKSRFLATTSHELHTPLNVILGLSQVLLRQHNSNLSDKQIDMVQRIYNNGDRLLEVIDDMLDFAKVEAGHLTLQIQEFDLADLILKIVAEHRSLAEEKYLKLQADVNLEDAIVMSDIPRLKQVLVKLLLNAIKFTESGSVEIKVWEISTERIAIAVQDTGIGIAESDLACIFEQFRQVDQTTTRKYGGIGLGLAITKSLVKMMQGTISVSSKIGEGSNFCIELPRQIKSGR